MATGLTAAELKTLQQIHKQMLALEKSLSPAPRTAQKTSGLASETDLAKLRAALTALRPSESREVEKIADIAKHLRADMSAKELANWIVPIERVLGRQLRDDQFLIYTTDAENATAEKLPLVFVLDNLRSAFNVGSIFRTAECFGVQKIYLAGYTPAPEQEKVASTAMGTAALVDWEAHAKIHELIQELKSAGHRIIGFETTSHAIALDTPFALTNSATEADTASAKFASTEPARDQRAISAAPQISDATSVDSRAAQPESAQPATPAAPRLTAFVFGNERFGLEPSLLDLCDEVRKIPLRGTKNSLNVGVATAIATYEFARQYAQKAGPS